MLAAIDGIRKVYEPLDIRIKIHNKDLEIPDEKPVALAGNHPSIFGFFGLAWAVQTVMSVHRAPRITNLKRPWWQPFDRFMSLIGGIRIDARSAANAAETTARELQTLKRDQWTSVFPDGALPDDDLIAANQKRLRDMGRSDLAERLLYTLSGRPTVTGVIASNTDCTWVVVDSTFDRPHLHNFNQIAEHRGATFHVRFRVVEPPPKNDREGVKTWLDEVLFGPCNDWIHGIMEARKAELAQETDVEHTSTPFEIIDPRS